MPSARKSKPKKIRGNGRGTVFASGKGFVGYLRRKVGASYVRSPKFTGRTKAECEFKIAEWNRPDEKGLDGFGRIEAARNCEPPKPAVTVGLYLERWWKYHHQHWASNTIALNESTRRVHFQDEAFLGLAFPPTIQDVRDFYGRLNGSADTKHRVHKLLRAAFQVAVDEQQITANPCVFKASPRKTKKSRVIAFAPEHERSLIAQAIGTPWEAAVLFMFDAGVRQGELFGVQVGDIDFERGEVDLTRSVDTVKGVATPKMALKTDSSVRRIQLAATTLRALRRAVEQKNGPSSYVFTDAEEALWTRTRFYAAWVRLLAEAGVPHYGPHSTRHTMATRLLRAGCYLPAVSARLGHASVAMTLEIYAHCLPSDQGALAASFDGFASSVVATGHERSLLAA